MDHEQDPADVRAASRAGGPEKAQKPGWLSPMGGVAIGALAMTGLGLLAAANTYTSHNAVNCGGGLGWIGPGLLNLAGLACAWTLAGGLVLYSLFMALRRRQWGWVVGLLVAAAASVGGSVGATSDLSHQVVRVVLGAGCSWFWPWVTLFVTVVPMALAGLAYTLLYDRPPRNALAA
jgi:hypothetical protein